MGFSSSKQIEETSEIENEETMTSRLEELLVEYLGLSRNIDGLTASQSSWLRKVIIKINELDYTSEKQPGFTETMNSVIDEINHHFLVGFTPTREQLELLIPELDPAVSKEAIKEIIKKLINKKTEGHQVIFFFDPTHPPEGGLSVKFQSFDRDSNDEIIPFLVLVSEERFFELLAFVRTLPGVVLYAA